MPSDGIGRLLAKAGGVAFGCAATGGYDDRLLVPPAQAGTPGYCLHPAAMRAFARRGKLAKTAARDGKAIEALAAAVTARKPVVRTKDQSIIKGSTALRRTLIISPSELKSRKARISATVAAETIAPLIAANLRAIKTIEAAIRHSIKDKPDPRHKAGQLLAALGAGPVLAAEPIGARPELGTLARRQVEVTFEETSLSASEQGRRANPAPRVRRPCAPPRSCSAPSPAARIGRMISPSREC